MRPPPGFPGDFCLDRRLRFVNAERKCPRHLAGFALDLSALYQCGTWREVPSLEGRALRFPMRLKHVVANERC